MSDPEESELSSLAAPSDMSSDIPTLKLFNFTGDWVMHHGINQHDRNCIIGYYWLEQCFIAWFSANAILAILPTTISKFKILKWQLAR